MAWKDACHARRAMREHLIDNPGARPSDLASVFGVHPSTADYHLRHLVDRGEVVRERVGRELHHYPQGEGWCRRARSVHARLTPAGRALVEIALERGVVSRRLVVARGFSRSATRWALDQMLEVGLVERAGWGLYELAEGFSACAVAAFREEACRSCNQVDQVARPTSRPSPRGRIVASRFD